MPLDTFKAPFDAAHASVYPVHSRVLNYDLRVQMGHVHLKARHSDLKLRDIGSKLRNVGSHLLLPTLKCFHSAPQNMELLHDEIGGFIDHDLKLVLFACPIHPHHSASAPEMISISSLVIIAWRVRFIASVCLRIISPALRVALSIALMRAPCSDAAFSRSARKI
jgi:hypothetical protein